MNLRKFYTTTLVLGACAAWPAATQAATPKSSVPKDTAAAVPAADLLPIQVQVSGVKGDQLKNVRLHLTIVQREKEKLGDSEVRELHGKVQKEVENALAPFGFYKPVVWSELKREDNHWLATYRIDPGPPLRIDSLDVQVTGEGRNDPRFTSVLATLHLRKGDVLEQEDYEETKDALKRAAIAGGYLDADFDVSQIRVDLARYAGAVVLHYETGIRYEFGTVSFDQTVVNDGLVRGYVNFKQGDPLDFGKLIAMQQALGQSPFWSRVEVRPDRRHAVGRQVPILVLLTPAKPERFTAGVGYGTDNGPHVTSTVQFRRLNRSGHRATLEGKLSQVEQSGTASYEIPWPYPRSDVLTLATGFERQNTLTSDERTGSVGATLTRLWAGWHEAFALAFRRDKFTVGLDQGLYDFLEPSAKWTHVRTNDPVDPTNATQLRFALSAASKAVLSAADYERLEAHAKWIQSYGKVNIVTGRLAAGQTWTSEFHKLPPSVRFFAGGAESVRGFNYNTLGPRDADGHVIGGRVLVEASLEYEYRFVPHWGVATFYDTGNAMNSFRNQLAAGTGVGLRWVSPVGLLKADLGYPLTNQHHALVVHLSIGPGL